MRHRCRPLVPLLASMLLAGTPVGARAQQPTAGGGCPLPSAPSDGGELALVLSGGGARGLAHIGVLRVLDSLGVRPTLVVGTSMGALVGALYAGGMSGAQIDALARDLPLEPLFRGYAPVTSITTGDLVQPVNVMTPVFVLEWRERRLSLRSPVAREPQLNALINDVLLHANLTAGGDFDRLPRRFRAIATDVQTDSSVVLRDGDLAEAVRASIAIPVVFLPLRRGDRLLVDGGLSANVPIAEARRAGASRVIISDVSTARGDTTVDGSIPSMLNYLIDELFTQPLDPLHPDDLRIRPAVRAYNPLNFSRAAVGTLIDRGHDDARRALAGCAAAPAPTRATSAQQPHGDEPFIRDRLARLASEGVYESVWLRPRRIDTLGLAFAPQATLAPERLILGDVAYDAHDGASARLATAHLAPAGGRLMAGAAITASAWRQEAMLVLTGLRRTPLPRHEARDSQPASTVRLPDPRSDAPPWSTLVRRVLRPALDVAATRQIVRLYDDEGHEGDRPTARELLAFASLGGTPAPGWQVALGPVLHAWTVHSAALASDDWGQGIGGLARVARIFPPPLSGPQLDVVPNIAAEGMWLDHYRRVSIHADVRATVRRLVLHPRGALAWGDGLPLGAQFVVGGREGFPGLRNGERRGTRMAWAALAGMYPIAGPVYARAEVGIARTSLAASDRSEVIAGAADGRVVGAEAGFMVDTPLGTLSTGYGVADNGRRVFKIGLGR